jgi:hypothetical protein
VTIKHLLALIIIISNTLINSVWASVHLVASDHDTLESPHLHIVSDLKTLFDFGTELDEASQEAEEAHFHVMSDLTTHYPLANSLKSNIFIASPSFDYRTQTYSPPIPPPTSRS